MEADTKVILDSNSYKLSNKRNKSSFRYIQILYISLLIIIALFIVGIFLFISVKNTLSQKISNLENFIKNEGQLKIKQEELIKNQEEIIKKQNETLKFQEEFKKKQDETIKNQEEFKKKHEEELKEANYKFSKLYNKLLLTHNLDKKFSYDKYLEELKYFCYYSNITKNEEYENEIKIANVDFKNITFDMYIYNESDEISNSINKSKYWDSEDTNKILDALDFYKKKNKTKSEELFILDIGSNIGWYSYFLGKIGYNIISFEPSERNYYILRKTYCLNNHVNIAIVNKALSNNEKICDYYVNNENKGKGKVICKPRKDLPQNLEKKDLVTLTKLNNYISHLPDEKIVFMKISVEGAEESVILGGIKLITKTHVPFIYLEFVSDNLNFYKVDKKKFLEIFEENGYKISTTSFLDKKYSSVNDLIFRNDLVKLFIVYTKIFEKNKNY